MSVLVVVKPSNFDLHQKNVVQAIKRGLIPSSELDELKREHDQHQESVASFESLLKANELRYEMLSRSQPWPKNKKFDLVVTIGGDGTLLDAAKHMGPDTPAAGICSTSTSVGFLCSVKYTQIQKLFDDFQQNRLPVKTFHRLGVRIKTFDDREPPKIQPVLNDVLFSATQPAATARYVLGYNNCKEVHKSSGVWISTAAGSSAAIKAAGGKVLSPTDALSQFCVREPYGGSEAYQLRNEVFDAAKKSLKILVKMVEAKLSIDGTLQELPLEYGDEVEFFQSTPFSIVRYGS